MIEQAAIIATSAGGPIGIRLALDYPDTVESLVLLNTGAALMSPSPARINTDDPFVADRLQTVKKRLALLDQATANGMPAAIAESEEEWRFPPQPPEPDPVLSPIRENRQRALEGLSQPELSRLAHGALLNMSAQRNEDLSDELHNVKCPVLIVHGDYDTTVPLAFGRALASSIPKAELVTLNGAEHGLIVDPEAQRVSTEWLSRVR